MIRVTWKGLVARPLRTALTTLAIVVGVAFVCAAYTLTDTMSGAADTLTHAAYDGTDAVVVTKTAFNGSQTSDIRAQAPTIPAATLARVRDAPGVTTAVGDITDTAQVIGTDGKPVGTGPYFGVGFDARTAGAERLTPFRIHDGRWAAGPGEVVIDRATAESQDYAVGDRIQVAARGEAQTFTVTGIANFANVKSLGKASATVFDLEAARTLFAKDGYDRILVAGTRNLDAGPGTEVRTAAEDDRFAFDSLEMLVGILRTILLAFAGVAVLVGSFTIFNSLSITVAQRTKEFGLLRMVGATPPPGARRRAARGARDRPAGERRRHRRRRGAGRGPERAVQGGRRATCRPSRSRSPPARSSPRCSSARSRRCSPPPSRPGARPRSRPSRRCGMPPRPPRRACSPAPSAAWRASSAARRPRSAAPPARSPAATRCATPAAPRSRRAR